MRVVFVCPRLHEAGTVGGAETLIYRLAVAAVELGHQVELLVTCAKNHFTWANELPEEAFERDGMTVRRFRVNPTRDVECFQRCQEAICRGQVLTEDEEDQWLRNSVNSDGLLAYLDAHAAQIDRIVAGPYLFGLVVAVAQRFLEKVLLAPCLHDEPFARVGLIRKMFEGVRGFLFNTEPERQLAYRLFQSLKPHTDAVVAMGIEPFTVDASAFARRTGITGDYLVYCGRREPLKGTPLLVDYVDCFRHRTGRDIQLVMTGSGAVEVPPEMAHAFHDLGFVSEQEKREAMAGAVAFCHPSINESLSIVLLEAWLAGSPALVHGRGAVLKWQCVRSNGGLWFENYPEFEASLLYLLEHRDQAKQMAQQGRAYTIQQYSPPAVRERLRVALEK